MKFSTKDKNLTLTLQGLSLVVTGIFSSFSSQDVLQQKLPHFQMDEVTPKMQRKDSIILLLVSCSLYIPKLTMGDKKLLINYLGIYKLQYFLT